MSIEERFPEIPSQLLGSDGLNIVFGIINRWLIDSQSSYHAVAEDTMVKVIELLSRGVHLSDSRYVEAIYPIIESAFDSTCDKDQSDALWALAILLKRNLLKTEAPSVLKILKKAKEELLVNAVWVVQMYAQRGDDISPYVHHLESMIQHQNYWIRHSASIALSEHEILKEMKQRVSLDESVRERQGLDGYWTISVNHRRLHGISSKAIDYPDYVVHFQAERLCGVCGYENARCIFYWDDSGTGWIDRLSEYLCPNCNNYTTYHYVD